MQTVLYIQIGTDSETIRQARAILIKHTRELCPQPWVINIFPEREAIGLACVYQSGERDVVSPERQKAEVLNSFDDDMTPLLEEASITPSRVWVSVR